MPSFRVVIERIIEEELLIDAEDESEAVGRALWGEDPGETTNLSEWSPTLIYSERVSSDNDNDSKHSVRELQHHTGLAGANSTDL